MQATNTVTVQESQLGASILKAVLAIMDNPEAARSGVLAHADAQNLSEEQLAKLEADREFMAHADAERESLNAMKDSLDKQKSEQEDVARKLNQAYDIHTKNVESLSDSVKLHNEDLKKHDEDKKSLQRMKNSFANEYSELLTAQEKNRKWEADLAKREKVLQSTAESMGWKQSAKG